MPLSLSVRSVAYSAPSPRLSLKLQRRHTTLLHASHKASLPNLNEKSALGKFTNTHLSVLTPLFGETYKKAKASNTKQEFLDSKEAASAAAAYGSSLVGSALQSYGVGALINATGTLSYKGAAYLGGLIFAATSAPTFISQILTEHRPIEQVGVSVVAKVLETVGLSMVLVWWGTRTNPFD
jgi:CTD nuclear envelope phosphatase 1